MSQIAVPLNKLILSPRNVRKTPVPDADIEILADSIASKGLLQNLVVSKAVAGKIYEVDAGGCRLRALQLLAKRGTIARNEPILCLEIPRDDAREASLAENTRFAMNPADEVTAYGEIIAQYADQGIVDRDAQVQNLARRFGRTVNYVEQRLRLAALAPDILEALRTERITLDVAKAYAGHPDHEVQLKVFAAEEKKPEGWRHGVQAVRDAIRGRIYPIDHRAVLYVGLEAYRAAGGRIGTDLFMGADEREQILDPSIVDRLVAEKARFEAERLSVVEGLEPGAVKPWQRETPAVAPGPAPRGMRWAFIGTEGDGRAPEGAKRIYDLKPDGSGLQATDYGFVPETTPPPARRPTSLDPTTFAQRDRRRELDTLAARLAMPPIAGTPLEGRTFWPAEPFGINALGDAGDDSGDLVVALMVRIPAADVAAMREQAEWELAERDAGAAKQEAAAAATRVEEQVA